MTDASRDIDRRPNPGAGGLHPRLDRCQVALVANAYYRDDPGPLVLLAIHPDLRSLQAGQGSWLRGIVS